jgi:hypothetical protein
MWVDCPSCGKEKAAWEDSDVTTFCGECEQRYRGEQVQEDDKWSKWILWATANDPTIHAVIRAYQPTFFTNPQGPEPLKEEVLQHMVMELFKSKEAFYKRVIELQQESVMRSPTCGDCFDYNGKCCSPQPGDRETMRRPESKPCERGVRRK